MGVDDRKVQKHQAVAHQEGDPQVCRVEDQQEEFLHRQVYQQEVLRLENHCMVCLSHQDWQNWSAISKIVAMAKQDQYDRL